MAFQEDKNRRTRSITLAIIIQFKSEWPSEERPKLLVSFSGSRPPKLSFSPAINLERAS